MIFKLYNTCGR